MKRVKSFLAGLVCGAGGLWLLQLAHQPVLPAQTPDTAKATAELARPAADGASPASRPSRAWLEQSERAVAPRVSEPSAPPATGAKVPVSVPAPVETPPSVPTLLRQPDLLVPVLGVTPGQLSDTFSEARGQGRSHEAIDILAPTGTAVLAVEDGTIAKLFESKPGGLTIYQFDGDAALAYYYAHLDAYATGLSEGQRVRRGEVIGYVGFSGNANPAAPHLHFAIFILGPEKRWWEGTAINPYPFLVPR